MIFIIKMLLIHLCSQFPYSQRMNRLAAERILILCGGYQLQSLCFLFKTLRSGANHLILCFSNENVNDLTKIKCGQQIQIQFETLWLEHPMLIWCLGTHMLYLGSHGSLEKGKKFRHNYKEVEASLTMALTLLTLI